MRSWIVALWLVITACPAPAQESAAAALAEATSLYRKKDNAAALRMLQRAIELSLQEQDRGVEAQARYYLGTALSNMARFDASSAQLTVALKLFEELGNRRMAASTCSFLGQDAWNSGKSDEARGYYEKSLAGFEALGDRAAAAGIHCSLSFVTARDEGMEHIRRGLELARASGARSQEAALLQRWADADYASDDFESAFERLDQARTILTELGEQQSLARVLTSLGRLYRIHGQVDQALHYYRSAYDIQKQTGDREGEIQSLNAMGVALDFLGRKTEALRHAEEGLQLARGTGSPLLIKFMLEATASRHIQLKQYGKAADLLEEGGAMPPPRHETLDLLSQARYSLGQYGAALRAAQEAIGLGIDAGEERRKELHLRAQALFRLGRTREALADVRQAMESFEQSRANLVPQDFMKQGYADAERELTGLAIQVLLAGGKEEEALEASEQARSRAFLDLLATKNMLSGEIVPANLPTRRDTAAQPDGLVSRNVAHAASADGMRQIARRLGSTILFYWVDDDVTIVWSVSPEGRITSAKTGYGAEKLNQWIDEALSPSGSATRRGNDQLDLRANSGIQARPNTRSAWRNLYDALIRPVRAGLPAKSGSALTVIPSGPLFRLSFAALMDEKGRYLIEDYAVHYSPAAEIFGFTLQNKLRVADLPAQYLLVANPSPLPTTPEGKPLSPLPGSEEEVNSILRLLPPSAVSTLRGTQADETRVRLAMSSAKIIHLATHGFVNAGDPFESYLALGRTGDQAVNDGRLTAREVYPMDLHADLVFLSACRTGLGRISSDGVAGLARAFFYAGAASVVSTLWDVADRPAAQLVPDFYRSLGNGSGNKSQALRTAQLHLLAALRKGQIRVDTPFGKLALSEDPVLWAGFVLMGEP